MNKKILPIFVMVMALSLLGVSCNKKTTDPTQTDNRLPFKVTLATAGIDSAPFVVKSLKGDATTPKEAETAGVPTVDPDVINSTKITATPVSMNLQNNTTDNITTPFTLDEFALDFSTANQVKLKVGGVSGTSDRDSQTFTSDVTGTVTFKLSAEGFKDSPLTVHVQLKQGS